MKPKFKIGQVLRGKYNRNYYSRVLSVKPEGKSFSYTMCGADFVHKGMMERSMRALTKRERDA